MSDLQISFLGAAGTVTGSKYLVEFNAKKILVDCGMFQGLKNLRLLNREPLPVRGNEIDTVLLTHAHLDHTGYLPFLVKDGFNGKIHCSEPTREITEIILRDSAHLQEEDADYANAKGYSKHKPALPLYGTKDVEHTLPLFHVNALNQWFQIDERIKFRFQLSGHILGSVFIELDCGGKIIVFSGDLGRQQPLTLEPPKKITDAQFLLIESTYGDRKHPQEDVFERFAKIVNETERQGGQVLIPCFAVGRVQDLLHVIARLKATRAISDLPVYVDSPMAVQTTKVFDQFPNWHKLNSHDLQNLEKSVIMVSRIEASRQIQESVKPAIIIAGSGMMTGGRILSHAYTKLRNPKNTFVLVGFQAEGTLGRFLKEGSDELKIFGEYIPVKARVEELTSLSAHADQSEIIEWLKGFSKPPVHTFIIHGEPHAANALRVKIQDVLGWKVSVPEMGSKSSL